MRVSFVGLLALVTLTACRDGPTNPPSATTAASLAVSPFSGVFDRYFQGQCGTATTYPLIRESGGTPVGTLTAFNDDFNVHLLYEAAPGTGLVRTSTELLEILNDLNPALTRSNGSLDFEQFDLQSRHSPPAARHRAVEPLDLISTSIVNVQMFPRVVVQQGSARYSAWAGLGPGYETILPSGGYGYDSTARHFGHPLQNCGPRVYMFNDVNLFDLAALANADNATMFTNIVYAWYGQWAWHYSGPRGPQVDVVFDRGRNSACLASGDCDDAQLATLRALSYYPATDIYSESGTLTSIPENVGVLILWAPRVPYTVEEINALKQFVAEAGRLIFVGENAAFYGSSGLATQNQFLADMGSATSAIGGAVNCGPYSDVVLADIPRHVPTGWRSLDGTEGGLISSLRQTCASALQASVSDHLLYSDASHESVLAASLLVSGVPIAAHQPVPSVTMRRVPPWVKATSTGQ